MLSNITPMIKPIQTSCSAYFCCDSNSYPYLEHVGMFYACRLEQCHKLWHFNVHSKTH